MKFIYSEWDDLLARKLRAMRDLMSIFNHLLLQVNGNVDLALDIMERLRKMGALPSGTDLDEFKENLLKKNLVSRGNSGLELTRQGERKLRQEAFEQIFENLRKSGAGGHDLPVAGGSADEILPEKRNFRFGDDMRNLDFRESVMNSIKRSASFSMELEEADLEVFDSDQSTNCATVLLIDVSHSMILYGEDRITPAKQIALALSELILTKYPKDSLDIVLFGDFAKEVQVKDLPYIGVGPYHTNTKAGLQMARRILLRRKHANKQIFMITDGKPSMITRAGGGIYRNPYGLDPIIVNRTLDEAIVCRKKRITISTFMITDDPYLQSFVQQLTELNHGRAYFSSADNVGEYIMWDFVSRKRRSS